MINYPFVKCLNPNRIVNPYTHEAMVVPCGHCEACRLNKHRRLTFQCKLESVTSGTPLFVTLTYSNQFVPTAQFVESLDTIGSYDLFDDNTGEQLNDVPVSESEMQKLVHKFNLLGHCPYLRKKDLVDFLKRLRYYVQKNYSAVKLRYFAVGEYGPIHFRPHYHLLLWCSDTKVKNDLAQYIYKAWPNGRIDVQLSQGDSARYVAGYVNSFGAIPEVYKSCSTCPFVLHSIKLGQGFLQGERAEIYSLTAQEFIRRSIPFDGRIVEFNLWRSCYFAFYPKIRGFASSSSRRLSLAYTAFRTLSTAFGTKELKTLSELTALLITGFYSDEHSIHSIFSYYDISETYWQNTLQPVLDWLTEDFNLSGLDNCNESFNRLVSRIYRDLSVSRHFLDFVCDAQSNGYPWPTYSEVQRKIRKIKDFYSSLDYMNLVQFFESQQLYMESDFAGDVELLDVGWQNSVIPQMYYNIPGADSTQTIIYRRYRADVLQEFYDSTKHKRLNDLNKVLFG